MSKQPKNKLLDNEFVKGVARALAYDLLRYSEHGGDMGNITAAKVYEFLERLDKGGVSA
ncbi:MAG: hypothetical protein FWD58_06605 [Firmicutes bacterium]|nr:hypothetical protein [Bacillota bacterium]